MTEKLNRYIALVVVIEGITNTSLILNNAGKDLNSIYINKYFPIGKLIRPDGKKIHCDTRKNILM